MDTSSAAHIKRLTLGTLGNNVWLLFHGSEALIIDASFDAQAIQEAVEGYHVQGIALTHGHFDHINAAPRLKPHLDNTPVCLHSADQFLWQQQHPDSNVDYPIAHGEVWQVGNTAVRAFHTPGHTPGSVCYYVASLGVVLTGDTLFPGGPGATRWHYSDFNQIIESIRTQLFTLPEATSVLPGHGETTTIGAEKSKLQEWIERGW